MSRSGFFSLAVEQLHIALEPLRLGLTSAEELAALVSRLGWEAPAAPFDMSPIQEAFGVLTQLEAAEDTMARIREADGPADPGLYLDLLDRLKTVLVTLRGLSPQERPPLPSPFNGAQFWSELPPAIVDYLLVLYLKDHFPAVYGLLLLLGIVTEEFVEGGGTPERKSYPSRTIHWDRLAAVARPADLLREVYGWDSGQFRHEEFLRRLGQFLKGLGFSAGPHVPRPALLDTYYAPDNPVREHLRGLYMPLAGGRDAAGELFEAGLSLTPIPRRDDPSGAPAGVSLGPVVLGSLPDTAFGGIRPRLRGGFESDQAIRLEIRPGEVHWWVADSAVSQVDAEASLSHNPPEPTILIGTGGSHRLQVSRLVFGVRIRGPAADPEAVIGVDLDGAELVLDLSEADGFLREVFGDGEPRVAVDTGIAWSSKSGIVLKARGGLEAAFPVGKRIGPVSVHTLFLGLASADGRLILTAALSGSVRLGPVTAGLEHLGARLSIEPRNADRPPGNFGLLDLSLGLEPPEGIALAIDTGLAAGGGSLVYEPDKRRYAGSLVLEIGNVTLSAVGLLDTRLPDGREGYSLLISIAASGFTPIQLGLGFTLNGIGGLLGVNHSVHLEVLRAGLKNATLDRVLFPGDPLAQLPRLIPTLGQVFPATAGRHLLGPAAIIGWGSPTLLTLELALVLELPAPVRLVLLGQVRALLPDEQAPILRLNMDAVGVVDFGAGETALDATLYRSRLMQFALCGDMALRGRWISEPGFILAVGGVSPRFNAPAALALPRLERVTLDLGRRDNPRLRLSAYLAISSNTVQLGALAELYLRIAGLSVQGALGFDLLIRLAPFGFVADLSGAVTVRWHNRTLLGVYLEASLSGPDPLVVRGKAKLKIWIFSKSVSFDRTLGEAPVPPPLPPTDPLPDLLAALADPRNWSAQLPADGHMLVALREVRGGAGVVLAHPLGSLEVAQGIVPLNLSIDRYRGAATGGRRFTLAPLALGEQPAPPREPVQDWFAPAQFLDLTDTERLSRPSFERMDAGLRIGAHTLVFAGSEQGQEGLMASVPIAYETTQLDRHGKAVEPPVIHTPDPQGLRSAVALRACVRKGLSRAGQARYRGPRRGVRVSNPGYLVASSSDLGAVGEKVPSYSAAVQDLAARRVGAPSQAQAFQVMGAHIVEEART